MATDDRLERTELGQTEYQIARSRLNDWLDDADMVAQEADEATQEAKRTLAAEDSLTELDAYLHGLSPEAHQTAIEGLRWYAAHFTDDLPIEQGRLADEA